MKKTIHLPDIEFVAGKFEYAALGPDDGSRKIRIWCFDKGYTISCGMPQDLYGVLTEATKDNLHSTVICYPPRIRNAIVERINAYHAMQRLTS